MVLYGAAMPEGLDPDELLFDQKNGAVLPGGNEKLQAILRDAKPLLDARIAEVIQQSNQGPEAKAQGLKQLGAWVSMIFLVLTGILLIKDLGRPDRFLYVLLRPQWRSWLTRGAYIISAYGAVLTAWIVFNYLAREDLLRFIEPIGIVLALLAAVYTAFLFAQAKGRDFWQSPMLGLHMIIHSLMAGMAVFLIASFSAPRTRS